MILAQPRWHKDYVAVLDRATTEGVARPSYEQKVKQNAIVQQRDFVGSWAGVGQHYNFTNDSGSDLFGLYNWRDASTFKITKIGTVTYVMNDGAIGNGVNGAYNTNRPPNAYNGNSVAVAFQLKAAVSSGFIFGCNTSGNEYFILIANPFGIRINSQSLTEVSPNGTNAFGLWYIARTSNTNVNFYYEGAYDSDKTQNIASGTSQNMYLFARNSAGSVNTPSTAQLRFWEIGTPNPSVQGAVKIIWDRYFTSL